jgi:LAS superfamily LD-carboxypeptidase LdcB
LAATPGTSNHGWGLSVDLDLDATAQAWMRQNGARYGFVEDVPREPWHWTFRAL